MDQVGWDRRKTNVHETEAQSPEDYEVARRVYGVVKRAYERQGDSSTAGGFFYREMECRRKGAKSRWKRAAYAFLFAFWGYGEKPFRVLAVGAATIVLAALVYTLIDFEAGFGANLYFSAASFTAIGYGGWVKDTPSIIRTFGVLEAIFGVIMIASFVATLTRKMTR